MITVSMKGNTIIHDIEYKEGAAKIIMKPAVSGKGVIAGGAIRAVVDLAGIKDIVSKSLGTANKLSVARAAVSALAILNDSRSRKSRMGTEK